MEQNLMKNMIILKDLPSNMIEEAYVVFKDNVKIHKVLKKDNKIKNENNRKEIDKNKSKDHIVKEAEMIIQDYIYKIEKKEYDIGKNNKKLRDKYERLKALSIFLGMFSILSMFVIIFK